VAVLSCVCGHSNPHLRRIVCASWRSDWHAASAGFCLIVSGGRVANRITEQQASLPRVQLPPDGRPGLPHRQPAGPCQTRPEHSTAAFLFLPLAHGGSQRILSTPPVKAEAAPLHHVCCNHSDHNLLHVAVVERSRHRCQGASCSIIRVCTRPKRWPNLKRTCGP